MDEYTDWTFGEIIDQMIRLRIKSDLSFAEKKEYSNLVAELDRRFAIFMPEPAKEVMEVPVEEEVPLEEEVPVEEEVPAEESAVEEEPQETAE